MLGHKNLEGILSGFTKIQKQLEAYNVQVAKDLDVNSDRLAELENDRQVLEAQAAKADTVYANLSTLLGE